MHLPDKAQEKSRLRQERLQRHWRQSDVAEQLGISVITVQRWERGNQQPGPYFRLKLVTLFGKSAEELGLLQGYPALPISSSADDFKLWNVPYPRNPHFSGREDLLEQLHQRLDLGAREKALTTRRAALTQAIKGLGGIGKTQIAVEYAYRAQEQGCYTHTLWINAANEEAMLTSFVALAHLLPAFPLSDEADQRKLVAAVKQWLEECLQPWLLIVDNADDLSLIQDYLPQRGYGSLLLTTRAHAVGGLAASLEVGVMGWVEGMQLLLHRAQRPAASEEESNDVLNLVMALDGFPLALDQAGAYIEETGCSVADYLQLYQNHRQALLARRGKQTYNYPDSVATTWSLSFQKVEQASPAAAELLRLCAFLAPDRIPEELLIQGAAQWTPILQQGVSTPLAFNQLVEELLAFSLVKRLAEDHLLSVHHLVQVVQQDAMTREKQHHWAERVVRGMHAIFPSNPRDKVAVWPLCLRYLEQAQRCDALIQQYQLEFLEAADLLERIGIYLHEHASFALARTLYQRALQIRELQLGSEHPLVATVLNNLAILSSDQGEYQQAERLYQQALQIKEQTFGPEHHEVARSLYGLARLYWSQGKYKQAEPLYQRALSIGEQAWGPEHPEIADALNGLAVLLAEEGRYEQAEPLLKRMLAIGEQTWGSEHPVVATALNNLAEIFILQSRYEEAKPFFQRSLRIWEQQLGPEHPTVASLLKNLAELSFVQGKHAEAERFYQRALQIWEQQLGPEHPTVAAGLTAFANFHRERGNYAEAEALYLRALSIRERALEPSHRGTAETLYGLAALREAQGYCQEAASLYQRVQAIHEQ